MSITLTHDIGPGESIPDEQVRIRNAGERVLSFEIQENVDWLDIGPTEGTLQEDGSQILTITYQTENLEAGPHTVNILVTSTTATNSPQTITVQVDVITEAKLKITRVVNDETLSVSNGENIAFPNVFMGTGTIRQIFLLKNIGKTPLEFSDLNADAPFIASPVPYMLPAGAEFGFTIDYPSDTSGLFSGTISFKTNDNDNLNFSLSVMARVLAAPVLNVTFQGDTIANNSEIDLGVETQNETQLTRTLSITNDGTEDLTTSNLNIGTPFQINDGLSSVIAPGVSDSVEIGLDTATLGAFSSMFVFNTNDPDDPTYKITVNATIQAPAEIKVTRAVDENTIDLTSNDYTLSFEPEAILPLQIFSVSNPGGGEYDVNVTHDAVSWIQSITPQSDTIGSNKIRNFSISLDVTGLVEGVYTANITITPSAVTLNPVVFTIELDIRDQKLEHKPTDSFLTVENSINPVMLVQTATPLDFFKTADINDTVALDAIKAEIDALILLGVNSRYGDIWNTDGGAGNNTSVITYDDVNGTFSANQDVLDGILDVAQYASNNDFILELGLMVSGNDQLLNNTQLFDYGDLIADTFKDVELIMYNLGRNTNNHLNDGSRLKSLLNGIRNKDSVHPIVVHNRAFDNSTDDEFAPWNTLVGTSGFAGVNAQAASLNRVSELVDNVMQAVTPPFKLLLGVNETGSDTTDDYIKPNADLTADLKRKYRSRFIYPVAMLGGIIGANYKGSDNTLDYNASVTHSNWSDFYDGVNTAITLILNEIGKNTEIAHTENLGSNNNITYVIRNKSASVYAAYFEDGDGDFELPDGEWRVTRFNPETGVADNDGAVIDWNGGVHTHRRPSGQTQDDDRFVVFKKQ